MRVGLIGDFDPTVTAHQAIPIALNLAARETHLSLESVWIPTESVRSNADVSEFDALWCVPASPYRSTDGALRAIQFAREHPRVFLATCGGFQHAIVEYARSVLGWSDAEHAETAVAAARPVISELACALVEVRATIFLHGNTRIAAAYAVPEIVEGYHCRYGLNPAFRDALLAGPLRVSAIDATGEVRAVELEGHPFYVATLFQPERAALSGTVPPLVRAFVAAAAQAR